MMTDNIENEEVVETKKEDPSLETEEGEKWRNGKG